MLGSRPILTQSGPNRSWAPLIAAALLVPMAGGALIAALNPVQTSSGLLVSALGISVLVCAVLAARLGFTPPLRLAIAVVGTLTLIAAVFSVTPTATLEYRIVLVACTLVAATPFLVALRASKPIDIGEPIYILAILYAVAFPFRAIYLALDDELLVLRTGRPIEGNYDAALIAAALSLLLMLAGYYAPIGRAVASQVPGLPQAFSRGAYVPRTFMIISAGLFAWLYLLYTVGRRHGVADTFSYSSGDNLIGQVTRFTLYGLALAAIGCFARRQTRNAGDFLALGSAVVVVAFTSFAYAKRIELLLGALILSLVWYYSGHRIPVGRVLLAAAFCLFVVIPVIGHQRSLVQLKQIDSSESLRNPVEPMVTAFEDLMREGVGGYVSQSMAIFMNRMPGVDTVAAILTYTPSQQPYFARGDYAVLLPPASMIPRAIWPDKPIVETQREINFIYFGRPDFDTHMAMYVPGSLLMSFGWIGLVIGSVVLGMVYRAFHHYCIVRSGASEVGVFVYVTLVASIVLGYEQNPAGPIGQMTKAAIFLAAIIVFMRLKSTRERARAPAVAVT